MPHKLEMLSNTDFPVTRKDFCAIFFATIATIAIIVAFDIVLISPSTFATVIAFNTGLIAELIAGLIHHCYLIQEGNNKIDSIRKIDEM